MLMSIARRLWGFLNGQPLTWTKLKKLNQSRKIKERIIIPNSKGMSSDHSAKPSAISLENPVEWKQKFEAPEPQYDWDLLCNENNTQKIQNNIENRKGVGDIHKVVKLWKSVNKEAEEAFSSEGNLTLCGKTLGAPYGGKKRGKLPTEKKSQLKKKLMEAAADIPNMSGPHTPVGDEEQARLIETVGRKTEFSFKPKLAVDIGEHLNVLRTKNVYLGTGPKTYYFHGELAQLEQALIKYTVQKLKKKKFEFVTVPDLIHPAIIEGCGFKTSGERTQVYKLEADVFGDLCMIGTAELSLAGYFTNEVLQKENLPRRLCAVSRCYRAETSDVGEEQGIYRVHQFSKVEMFGVTSSDNEDDGNLLLEEYLDIEKEIFSELDLYFRILEMPTQELGAPAFRKFDIEAWMHGQQIWGEISSASNCTDFQSRRLNIRYTGSDGLLRHATTVNGTACAVPRIIMAIFEKFQQKDGSVYIPEILHPFMEGKKILTKSKVMPDVKWIRPLNFK